MTLQANLELSRKFHLKKRAIMFRVLAIKFAFGLIERLFVAKIPNPSIQGFVKLQLKPAQRVAYVLTDKNPENEAQLLEIWRQENDQFVAAAFIPLQAVIMERIKDPAMVEDIQAILNELQTYLVEAVEGSNK